MSRFAKKIQPQGCISAGELCARLGIGRSALTKGLWRFRVAERRVIVGGRSYLYFESGPLLEAAIESYQDFSLRKRQASPVTRARRKLGQIVLGELQTTPEDRRAAAAIFAVIQPLLGQRCPATKAAATVAGWLLSGSRPCADELPTIIGELARCPTIASK